MIFNTGKETKPKAPAHKTKRTRFSGHIFGPDNIFG